MASAVNKFTVAGISLGNSAKKGTPNGTNLPSGSCVSRMGSTAFGLAKELKNGNVDGSKVFEDLVLDGCRTDVASKAL